MTPLLHALFTALAVPGMILVVTHTWPRRFDTNLIPLLSVLAGLGLWFLPAGPEAAVGVSCLSFPLIRWVLRVNLAPAEPSDWKPATDAVKAGAGKAREKAGQGVSGALGAVRSQFRKPEPVEVKEFATRAYPEPSGWESGNLIPDTDLEKASSGDVDNVANEGKPGLPTESTDDRAAVTPPVNGPEFWAAKRHAPAQRRLLRNIARPRQAPRPVPQAAPVPAEKPVKAEEPEPGESPEAPERPAETPVRRSWSDYSEEEIMALDRMPIDDLTDDEARIIGQWKSALDRAATQREKSVADEKARREEDQRKAWDVAHTEIAEQISSAEMSRKGDLMRSVMSSKGRVRDAEPGELSIDPKAVPTEALMDLARQSSGIRNLATSGR